MSFKAAAKTADLSAGEMKRVLIDGKEILLANLDGTFYATDDICTHADANLSDGELDGELVECPLHAACFNVKTGKAETDPAEEDLQTYEVKVEGDEVLIKI